MLEWKTVNYRRKRGERRREEALRHIIKEDRMKNKSESEDTENRKKVLQMIANDIANGITKEKAIENIMKNPIIKNLSYIEDLPNVLKGWIETANFKRILTDRKIEIRTEKIRAQEEAENAGNNIDEDER